MTSSSARSRGEIVREHINSKQVEYVPDAARTRRGPCRGRWRTAGTCRCLDADAIAALVDAGAPRRAALQAHQDVEWALARGSSSELFIVQSRPVTALPKREGQAAADLGDCGRDEHVRRDREGN